MNKRNITAISAAVALAFSVGAMAAEGMPKDGTKAAASKPTKEQSP